MKKLILIISVVCSAMILNAGVIEDYAGKLTCTGSFGECVANAKATVDADKVKAEVVEWAKGFAKLSHDEKIARKNERVVACVGLGKDFSLWAKIPYNAGRYINHWYTIESRNVGAWYDETKASGFVIEGKNLAYFKAEIAFVCGDYEYATYLPADELLKSPYWLRTLKKQLAQEKDFAKFYEQLCKIDAYFYERNKDGSTEHDALQSLIKKCVSRIASEKLIK